MPELPVVPQGRDELARAIERVERLCRDRFDRSMYALNAEECLADHEALRILLDEVCPAPSGSDSREARAAEVLYTEWDEDAGDYEHGDLWRMVRSAHAILAAPTQSQEPTDPELQASSNPDLDLEPPVPDVPAQEVRGDE